MPAAAPVVPFTPSFRAAPRLLVSVRSADEALAALRGGCDVLDVKEPSRGPLGMADLPVICQIAHAAADQCHDVSLSIALGESRDWLNPSEFPRLPHGVDFVKAGVAGISLILLRDRLKALRDASLSTNGRSARPLGWVLAAYADAEAAGAPDLDSLFHLANELDFRGVLIDTWNKSGPRLSEQVNEPRLIQLRNLAHSLDLQFAVAGRLQRLDLPLIRRVLPDIVGIRSAACAGDDRNAIIVADRVHSFRHELQDIRTATREPASRPDRLTASNGGVK